MKKKAAKRATAVTKTSTPKAKPAKWKPAAKRKPAAKQLAKKKPANKVTPKPKATKKAAAPKPARASASSVEAALRSMLASLDTINDQNSGLTDTDVREILARTVIERLVEKKATPIPDDFQMMEGDEMSPAHDQLVKRAVSDFVAAVEGAAEWQSCSTDGQRKALIARDDVMSIQGNAYWLYLGDWS
jgi:hypothetical protein